MTNVASLVVRVEDRAAHETHDPQGSVASGRLDARSKQSAQERSNNSTGKRAVTGQGLASLGVHPLEPLRGHLIFYASREHAESYRYEFRPLSDPRRGFPSRRTPHVLPGPVFPIAHVSDPRHPTRNRLRPRYHPSKFPREGNPENFSHVVCRVSVNP